MKYIDKFLNGITMYRLVLYALTLLSVISIAFAYLKILPLDGTQMVLTLGLIVISSALFNKIFSFIFKVPTNIESVYITAFILFLVWPPILNLAEAGFVVLVSGISMASKYVFNISGKHVFNPAAFGIFVLSAAGLAGATWWVASEPLVLLTAIIGFLIVRKIRRFDVVLSFVIVAVTCVVVNALRAGGEIGNAFEVAFESWPVIFLGTVMLTEPLTSPPSRKLRVVYGVIVGLIFGIPFNSAVFSSSPEFALLIGNIFAFIVSPKGRITLRLKEKVQLGSGIYDFIFQPNRNFAFNAGQYVEWTLPHGYPDARGVRRYFTIASSPKEKFIHLGVKVPERASSFKTALVNLPIGGEVVVGGISGDFVLNKNTKIMAVAGGIGVTPFRSMAMDIIDAGQKNDFVLFYAATSEVEFVYKDVFKQAEKFGFKTVFIITGKDVPMDWQGERGFITEGMVKKYIPDYLERECYLSGPNVMVEAYKKLFKGMGISSSAIHTDYFPGY